jgi:hypothetical protein
VSWTELTPNAAGLYDRPQESTIRAIRPSRRGGASTVGAWICEARHDAVACDQGSTGLQLTHLLGRGWGQAVNDWPRYVSFMWSVADPLRGDRI